MKTVKVVLCLLMVTVSSAFAQVKGEMPFTSSSPNANALLRKAWAAMADANMEEGNKYVQQVLQEDPACAMAYLSDPTIKEEERDANIRRAEGLKLSEDEKLFLEGLKASGDKKPARQYFDPLLKKYPRDHYLHLTVMFIVHPQEPAIDIGESIIKRNPKFAPAYNLLGYAYMEKDEMAKAESNFDKYITLRPDLANPYDSKGDFMMKAGRLEDAVTLYEKAASLGMADSKRKAERVRALQKYPAPSKTELDKIAHILSESFDGYEKGTVDDILKHYADQSVEILGNQMTNVGLPNLRRRTAGTLKNGAFIKEDFSLERIKGAGPIAVAYGKTESIFRSNESGKEVERNGNAIFIMRKHEDGNWKILADHFYDSDADAQPLAAEDVATIRQMLDNWGSAVLNGEALSQEHLDHLATFYSAQAIEILPTQWSNVGLANLRVRWNLFLGARFETNSLGVLGAEGLGRRAIAWGIADQHIYAKDSEKLQIWQFPWAMILTKEKDDAWRILALHWGG